MKYGDQMYLQRIKIDSEKFPVHDTFPFNIKAFQTTQDLEIRSKIVFFSGENGVGKSALLDAIARKCAFMPWGGSKTHRFSFKSLRNTTGPLYQTLFQHSAEVWVPFQG